MTSRSFALSFTDCIGEFDPLSNRFVLKSRPFMSLNLQSVDPSYLAMMMRMGRKYEIASLTSTALEYMQRLFPPTLEQWDACQQEISTLCSKQNKTFIFDIINLAYDSHVPSILPAAFLSLWHIHSLVCLIGCYNNNTTYQNLVKDTIISGIQCLEDDRPLVVLRTLALQNCLVSRTNFKLHA